MLHTEVIWELYPWKTGSKSKNWLEAYFVKFYMNIHITKFFTLNTQEKKNEIKHL